MSGHQKELRSPLLSIWETAKGTSLDHIISREFNYFTTVEINLRLESYRLTTTVNIDMLARALAIPSLPPAIQDQWHKAFDAKTPKDYDQFMEQAQQLNPYYRGKFSVHGNHAMLRTIGWSFTALDVARIMAAGRIIAELPNSNDFCVLRGDDPSGIYWQERSNWGKWTEPMTYANNTQTEVSLRTLLHPQSQYMTGELFSDIIQK